ncbi:hypothetical protein Taro_052580 [Colocasia esculenta]|uniref:BURP domain-containing protein n=1 Tax=Colocasia esculenta TaxID=4460 RepID=A0A843XIZ9_COLES|nr:hypothetical protein [Colocasia esculenta]
MTLRYSTVIRLSVSFTSPEASNFFFSSKKLPTLLSLFSFHPASAEAKHLRVFCHLLEIYGELHHLQFWEHHVWALSTDVPTGVIIKQEYMVASSLKLTTENNIACHLVAYLYEVFYCHVTSEMRTYVKYDLIDKYVHGCIPDEDILFLEDIIVSTRKLLMNINRGFPPMALLSHAKANNFFFSSKKLPILLSLFSFHPASTMAKYLRVRLDT